ncbi:ethanolamine kinase 2-like [Lineus longissimus]|uniref:ethanolamine kinase 2-like n=1 Tax=Lineus longissimus TaxID=88925 RepID=UPI002B4C7056
MATMFDFETDVPLLGITIDPDNPEKSVKEVLKVTKKTWSLEDVKLETGNIGYVNKTLVAVLNGGPEKVVFRVFTESFAAIMNKEREKVVTLLLHELKIAPSVICVFANGICFEFIEGETFHWKDFSAFDDIRLVKSVMRELARFHSQKSRDLAINKYHLEETDFLNGHMSNCLKMYPDEERVQALPDGEVK